MNLVPIYGHYQLVSFRTLETTHTEVIPLTLHESCPQVFVNGIWVGVHREPMQLVGTLRELRRQVAVNSEVGFCAGLFEQQLVQEEVLRGGDLSESTFSPPLNSLIESLMSTRYPFHP